ncbi:MAG: BtpA/SgcQ family protein [Polyangiaceae bacterium]|nr:BtpA/SgcQ family protein [Polyangiaceae bacterium]
MTPAWKLRKDALQLKDLKDLFGTQKPIIGMVHCWPLPGAPHYAGGGVDPIIEHAIADARALEKGGAHGVIVENMWDIPFRAGSHLPPESIAVHAVIAREVKRAVNLPMGINLVHNGGVSALAIAIASGASFMRVCMFTGAGVWESGSIDEGCAAELLRRRSDLRAEHIKLFCDVDKKHSVRFPGIDLATHIEWTRFSGGDALIISGKMTGNAPNLEKVHIAKSLAGNCPVLIGSGADENNIADFLTVADGAIVGTSVKVDGVCENPVDVARVTRLVNNAKGITA